MLTPYKRADVEFEWISDLEDRVVFQKYIWLMTDT